MKPDEHILKPCPRCGSKLTERVNRETERPFWGCSRWPDCTFTMSLPESVKLRRAGQIGMFDEPETEVIE